MGRIWDTAFLLRYGDTELAHGSYTLILVTLRGRTTSFRRLSLCTGGSSVEQDSPTEPQMVARAALLVKNGPGPAKSRRRGK